MYRKIIRNDIKSNKLITLAVIVFIAVAAMLVSLAAIMIVTLSGSIDTMMEQAKTPHFLQMHSGDIDSQQLQDFVRKQDNVTDYQSLEFLNLDGAKMSFGENSLVDSVEDNGISVQSERFDFLLDLDGNVLHASDGEIYVPISYMKDGTAQLGDKAIIYGKEFVVAGFLRDSQMNSTLSSSKRFLVSENDYAELRDLGTLEYLIEFRLTDSTKVNEFETTYINAGLPANGPMVTYPLFRMMNAITDGIVIAVILMVGILVILIAFLCIRFTLIARIEDDTREIGTMKAIGMRVSEIKKIYLSKYAALACIGGIIGFLLSFVFKNILLENIRLYMGEGENAYLGQIFALIGVAVVFAAILLYVNGVLHYFHKISAVEAIRFGAVPEEQGGSKRLTLSNNKLLSTNVFLGLKDVLSRKKLYVTMLAVLVISAFIIIVPQKLYDTISSNDFSGYMGVGYCDLRMDIQQTDNMAEKAADVAYMMEHDENISTHVLLTTQNFTVKDDGAARRIRVELGDHSVFPVAYINGHIPTKEDEIALSVMNADDLGKDVGDILLLSIDGREAALSVCGIYSDLTNGGKTAKAVFTDVSAETMWYLLCAEIPDKTVVDSEVEKYSELFSFAKTAKVDTYIEQMFGATINSIKTASYGGILIAVLITLLVTLLFLKMLIAKDRYSIAAMKAFGFRHSDISKQYMTRFSFVLIIALILGVILANTLGQTLAGMLISVFGVSSFEFSTGSWWTILFCLLVMVGSVLVATIIGTRDIKKVTIAENVKE